MKKLAKTLSMLLLLAGTTVALESCSRDDANSSSTTVNNNFSGTLTRTENGVTAKIVGAEERVVSQGSIIFLQIEVTNNVLGSTPQGTVDVTIKTTDGQILSNGGATFLSSQWGGATVKTLTSVITVPASKTVNKTTLTVSQIR